MSKCLQKDRCVDRRFQSGFTVIELLVVLAVIALLMSIASPRYMQHLDTAREITLKADLHQMRDAIGKFYTDQGRYPADLKELVAKRYLREVPADPMTDRVDTWVLVSPDNKAGGGVFDVRSGAQGQARDGRSFSAL